MRLIWSGFLMTGLLLMGMSAYERRQSMDERRGLTPTAEGGFPYPSPNGTPTPPPSNR
jgi:hypothetical protein